MNNGLNTNLIEKNKVSIDQQARLLKIYDELGTILLGTRKLSKEDRKRDGKAIAKRVRELEFELQENWNFSVDANYHTYWNKVTGCTCPVADNEERFGQDKVINCRCPYHGNNIKGE